MNNRKEVLIVILLFQCLLCKAQQTVEFDDFPVYFNSKEIVTTIYSEKEINELKSKCFVGKSEMRMRVFPTVGQEYSNDPYTIGAFEYTIRISELPLGQDINLNFIFAFEDGSKYETKQWLKYQKKSARLLSIGTGNNPDPYGVEQRLDWSQNEADSVFVVFKNCGDNCYVYSLQDLLNNENATKENILKSLEAIEEDLDSDILKERVVLLYLNGHGRLAKDTNGKEEFQFVCKDGHGIDRDYIAASEINTHLLNMVEKGAIVWVFIDACYSTYIYNNLAPGQFIGRPGSLFFYTASIYDENTFTNGVAKEGGDGSLFTMALLKSISSIIDEQSDITAQNLSDAIIARLAEDNIKVKAVQPYTASNLIPKEAVLFSIPHPQMRSIKELNLNLSAGFYGVYNPFGIRAGLNYRHFDGFIEMASGSNRTFDLETYEMPFRFQFSFGGGLGVMFQDFELSIGMRYGRMISMPLTLVYDWDGETIPPQLIAYTPDEMIHSIETITVSAPFFVIHPTISFYPLSRIKYWKHVFVSFGYNVYFNISDGSFTRMNHISPLYSWSIATGYTVTL